MSEQTIWLVVASTMPIDYEGEKFYFDTKEMEFFIVGAYDYLLNTNNDAFEFQYPDEVKSKLIGKLKRIELLDPTIVEVPRMTFLHRRRFQSDFVFYIKDDALKERFIKYLDFRGANDQLILDRYITPETVSPELVKRWSEAKLRLARTLASKFEREHNVSLKDIALWKIEQARSVKKVEEAKVDYDVVKGKPWWKIW